MSEKIIKSRMQQKHDTETNWDKAVNFVPKPGEILIYDADETYNYQRMKIGNGQNNPHDLPFLKAESTLEVDPGLTQPGQAADAEAVGNELTNLQNALDSSLPIILTQREYEQLIEDGAIIVDEEIITYDPNRIYMIKRFIN